MPKKIYLVRHGETDDLVKKLHQHNDVALSERGNKQARDVAVRFSHIKVDVIFSSPHVRTVQTAEHIRSFTHAPLEISELLRESRQPHEIVGKERESADVLHIKEIMREHRNDPSWHYSDEENFFDLSKRINLFHAFLKEQPHEDIVLVTHAVFIKMFTLIAVFGELLTPDLFRAFYLHVRTSQTGITMFEYKDDTWRLLTWNDYAHLGEDTVGTGYKA